MSYGHRQRLAVMSAELLEAFADAAADPREYCECTCSLCGRSSSRAIRIRKYSIVGRAALICSTCVGAYACMAVRNGWKGWQEFSTKSTDAFEDQDPINIARWLALRISKVSTSNLINAAHKEESNYVY